MIQDHVFKKWFLPAALFFGIFSLCQPVFADTVRLKSGQVIEGKIIENNGEYVKIDFQGVELVYFRDEIATVTQKEVGLQAAKEISSMYEAFNAANNSLKNKPVPVVSTVASQEQIAEQPVELQVTQQQTAEDQIKNAQAALAQLPKEYQDALKKEISHSLEKGY